MNEHISPEKINDLKKYIVASYDALDPCKCVLLWLIDRSKGLKFPCHSTVNIEGIRDYTANLIIYGIHAMNSSELNTQLSKYMRENGIEGYFESSYVTNNMEVRFGGYHQGKTFRFPLKAIRTKLDQYRPDIKIKFSTQP